MFHSSGTIQSKTRVPLGISVRRERDLLGDHVEGRPDAVAGQAAAEREQPLA